MGFSFSYLMIIAAIVCRPSFLVFFVLIIIYDLYKVILTKNTNFNSIYKFITGLIPIIIGLVIIINILINQSNHPWNNPLGITSDWLPNGMKSMGDTAFIVNMNVAYIDKNYGSRLDQDIYNTNNELFNGATSPINAIYENPKFVFTQIGKNIIHIIEKVGFLSPVTRIFNHILINPETSVIQHNKIPIIGTVYFLLSLLFLLIIIYASYQMTFIIESGLGSIGIFFISLIIVFFSETVFGYPQIRRLIPLFPLCMFATIYFIYKSIDIIASLKLKNVFVNKNKILFNKVFNLSIILLFTPGLTDWRLISKYLINDFENKQIHLLKERPYSPLANVKEIEEIVCDCRGIMTLEHKLLGGLTNVPTNRIYDVWEIPPFGSYGTSDYNGLVPERIDCLLISQILTNSFGASTNFQMRYDNYIKPYSNYLEGLGANTIVIPNYGKAVLLQTFVDNEN